MNIRGIVLVCFVAGACSKSSDKDAEIAALKAQLANQQKAQPSPNPQPETAPPRVAGGSRAPKVPSAGNPADDLSKKIVNGVKLSPDELKALVQMANVNKSITYAHLKKNADKYTWRPWRLTGRIVEIAENNGLTRGRVSLSDYADQAMYFEYGGETDFVENNIVEMAGVLASNFSYTSQAGWKITIPAISVAAITKRGQIDKLAGIKHKRSEEDEEY
jgi:hypothetical protein